MAATQQLKRIIAALCVVLGMAAGGVSLGGSPALAQTADSWTTSLHDNSRDGASTDTVIPESQAPYLTKLWSFKTGGPIASQPAIVGGVAYVGSWDGYEYAFNVSTGAVIWKTNLGITNGNSDCNPPTAGVSSAATVLNGVVYVGGGDSYWYALDASTGAVLWRVNTGDNSAASGHYNWSSPLIVNGYAYIGVSSLGDCPLVQGQLIQVNLATHAVVNTLNLVPNGSVGGGIWTSPAYDPALNEIFTVTGTETSDDETYAQALLGIDASSLTVKDYWHLPEPQAVADSDWTTSTGLYTGSNGVPMLVATDKNGYTYAFDRRNLAAGPLWSAQVAIGNDCAACGYSTVSSAAISGNVDYQAGGVTTIGGVGYGGSVQALNATTGAVLWQHPEAGPVIGAITSMNGMVIAGAGSALEVLDAATGHRIYSYDTGPGSWIYAAPAVANGVIITGNTAGSIYAFALPATLPGSPPPDPNCPSAATCQDIGSPAPAGSESVSGGVWNVSAGGAGFSGTGTSDQFRLLSQASSGDVQIVARLTALPTTAGAEAGLMLRQNSDPGSPYYAVVATSSGITVQYRHTFGAAAAVANTIGSPGLPVYLEIQRRGDVLTAATSTDGVNYYLVPGTTETVVMPYASLAGLAVSSGASGTSGSATFDNFTVGGNTNTPAATPSAQACPSGWNCGDVGDPLVVGGQSQSGGTWTFTGAGTGFGNGGLSDQFHYVWTTSSGDTTLSTHITAQANTNAGATAGLMIRAGTGANAAFYGVFLTPGNGIKVMERTGPGTPITVLASQADTVPAYLEIARSADVFTAYTSADGTNWTPVIGGTDTISALSGTVLEGFAMSSAVATTTGTVNADVFSVTGSAPAPPTACPANWTCADIASAIPAGSNYLVNGQWSILGGGKDIWGSKDEFRYVAEALPGDGTVSAKIVSQQDTDAWAKSGIMLRASADPGAPYFAILATGENGTVIQYRTTQGGSTSQVTGVTSGPPIYVEVKRSGTTFTAYTSTDGVNWTAYPGGSVTIAAMTGNLMAGMADTSHSQFVTSTTVFANFTLTQSSSLPSPWTDSDVGSPAVAGSAAYAGGVFTVKGAGADVWGSSDQFNYVSQPASGDFTITARVTAQSNTDPWAKAGVIIKQSTAAGTAYAMVAATPGNGITFQYGYNHDISGGSYTFPNAWVRLTRSGSTVTAYTSADGAAWTQVGSTTIAFTDPVTAGLIVCSHSAGQLSTSTFDNVSLTPASSLPSPWTDSDVGAPAVAGSAAYANGVFTVKGAGADVWNTTDQFNYVSQPASGNFTITAQVTSQSNTDAWAKSGVIIKQSTTSGTAYAMLAVTPGNGITFQYGYNTGISGGTYTFPNAWVRLTRSGATITAYTSADGATWTQVGEAAMTFTDPVTAGLIVCSHSPNQLNTSTFANVSLTSVSSSLPSPWTDSDVGSPALAGSASYASGVFTVKGAGADVWGSSDQFNYVSQPVSGSFTITARVTSQSNTDQWAKSGVIIKQSTATGTAYAMLAVTPGNGITFQYGYNTGVGGGSYTFPNGWVRLTRSGSTITAYTSADGATWTQAGTATVNLTDPITAGLIVCSHNPNQLGTSTFDNVTVTSP